MCRLSLLVDWNYPSALSVVQPVWHSQLTGFHLFIHLFHLEFSANSMANPGSSSSLLSTPYHASSPKPGKPFLLNLKLVDNVTNSKCVYEREKQIEWKVTCRLKKFIFKRHGSIHHFQSFPSVQIIKRIASLSVHLRLLYTSAGPIFNQLLIAVDFWLTFPNLCR